MRASAIGASAEICRASSSAGSFENGSKQWYTAIALICAATASTISRRPCPTLTHQRLAMPSRYSLPWSSQTTAPSPRTIVTKSSRVGRQNGCRNAGSAIRSPDLEGSGRMLGRALDGRGGIPGAPPPEGGMMAR